MMPMHVELLVPASYDIVWTIVMIALVALVAWASVAYSRRSRLRRQELEALRADVDAIKADAQPSE